MRLACARVRRAPWAQRCAEMNIDVSETTDDSLFYKTEPSREVPEVVLKTHIRLQTALYSPSSCLYCRLKPSAHKPTSISSKRSKADINLSSPPRPHYPHPFFTEQL